MFDEIEASPSKDDISYLNDQLEEFNAEAAGRHDFQPLQLVVRDPDGSVIAGLKAVTGWDWLYVQILWVHASSRKQGIGTRLLSEAESIAQERGCVGSCLSSFTFQAPGFYQRHGYSRFGQIDDYPAGQAMIFFSKRFSTT